MTQSGAVFLGPTTVQIELPACGDEALPGVAWGSIDAFPTPAYWAYQVIARRVGGAPVRHRLGQTLAEEVAACLLGGHGIPASVGMAAFRRLQSLDMLASAPSEEELLHQLIVPLVVNGRPVKYRFARQKAKYLDAALKRLTAELPPMDCGRALRDWLVDLPGIGFKTASWVARNWLDADDVAILDIHILRAGALGGFFDRSLTVDRDYQELEAQFIRFSRAIGVRPSELDAVIWFDPHPVVKLYTLDAGAVWLLVDLDADGDKAYGLCDAGTGFPELGYVSLSALEGMRGPKGLCIVADPHFEARQSLSAYTADAVRDGSIND